MLVMSVFIGAGIYAMLTKLRDEDSENPYDFQEQNPEIDKDDDETGLGHTEDGER